MSTFQIATFFLVILIYCSFSQSTSAMASGDTQVVPDKFLGTFKLEKSENFDEFLASKGVNWFVRKMIQMASITKVFKKSEQPNRYTALNLSSKENTEWKDWALNESFEAKGLDGTKHKITFALPDENTFTERHIRLEFEGDNDETYQYTREGDYLILKMDNSKVTCRRFFKVQPETKK